MLPRSEVWASTVCASGIQPCVLQKMGQRRVTSTYLSSIPSVARCVHQRRMARCERFGSVSAALGHSAVACFPEACRQGCVRSRLRCAGGTDGAFAPRDLLPRGCCEVLRAQEAVTTKGRVPGVGSPQRWPVSFGAGFGPVATVSWGGVNVLGDCAPPG